MGSKRTLLFLFFFLQFTFQGLRSCFRTSVTKFPLAPGFCLCWHAAEASCSRCAGSEGLQTAASLRYTWAFLKQRLEGVNGLTLGFSQELLVWWKQSNLFSIVDLKLLNCWRNMGNFSDEVPVRFGSCSFTYCPSRQRNRHIRSVIYLFLQKPSGLTNTVRPTLYVAVHLIYLIFSASKSILFWF